MSKTVNLVIIFFLLFWIMFITWPHKTKNISQKISNNDFIFEIANTPRLQTKGLSGRQELCKNCGMLFVFNKENIQTFWMKDTLIPLDIIFIDQNFIITDIYTATPEPGVNDFSLKLYQSSRPTKYVIEINANQANDLGLKVGDHLNLQL